MGGQDENMRTNKLFQTHLQQNFCWQNLNTTEFFTMLFLVLNTGAAHPLILSVLCSETLLWNIFAHREIFSIWGWNWVTALKLKISCDERLGLKPKVQMTLDTISHKKAVLSFLQWQLVPVSSEPSCVACSSERVKPYYSFKQVNKMCFCPGLEIRISESSEILT